MNARPPASLPRRARSVLAQYRDAEDIPSEVEARIWAVVGADDAPAPAFDPSPEDGAPDPADRTRTRTVRWIGLGLAAAAVLAVAWSVGGTIAERRQSSMSHEAPMQVDVDAPQGHVSAKARATAVAEVRTPAPQAAIEEPVEPEAVELEAVEPRVVPRPKRTNEEPIPEAVDAEPVPSSPTSTLAAERELIARAWRALAHGDTAGAVAATSEHSRRFDAGLLAPEREAVETIARCRNDEPGASARAQAFHRSHPRSPLAGRVDEACGTADEEK